METTASRQIGSSFEGVFDSRFEEKLRMEGFTDDDLKCIAGKPVDFPALARLSLSHSDGVIIHTEHVHPEVMRFIEENNIPYLPYEGSFDVDKYAEFYKSI